jgi:hypothetical protein
MNLVRFYGLCVETLLNFSLEPFCPVNGTFDSGFSVSMYLFNSMMNYEPSKENTTNQVIF